MKPGTLSLLVIGLLATGCGPAEQPSESTPETGLAQRESALVNCVGAISCENPVQGWVLVSTSCGNTWSCEYPVLVNSAYCRGQREPTPECIDHYEPGPTTLLRYELSYYCTMPGGTRCPETEVRIDEGACHC